MRLHQLTLRNFKGIRSFTFEPGGKSCAVMGENATGKTTLFDAYLWLMTGKDSLDQAPGTFELKTISNGETPHNLDHEVEGTFTLNDGTNVVLKKVYSEKWTKKRGQATAKLTGHTINHSIDDVPKSEREYNDYVNDIAPWNVFKLLTNVRYFNEGLSWQDRRKILLNVCGDISDSDVITSSHELHKLPMILGKKTVEDWRKVAASSKTRINSELQEIPSRIDEADKGKAVIQEGVTRVGTLDEIQALQSQLSAKRSEIDRIKNGGEVAEKTKNLREIEGRLIALANRESEENEKPFRERRAQVGKLRDALLDKDLEARALRGKIDGLNSVIEAGQDLLSRLRKAYSGIFASELIFEQNENCPTCGQSLPESQLETAHRKAIDAFNVKKSQDLEANKKQGMEVKVRVQDQKRILAEAQSRLTVLDAEIQQLKTTIEKLEASEIPIPLSDEIKQERDNLLAGKEILESAISELNQGNHDVIDELSGQAMEIELNIQKHQTLLADIDTNQRAEARIRQLSAQQKKLASEFEQLEAGIFLTDLFVRAKVLMLTDRINSKFSTVSFKLFNILINGGTEECCATTVGGVPYPSLNEAARIAAGCEIAEVLSEHHGVWLPRWIDGCESILNVPSSKGQVIKLVVNYGDKTMRIETEE